MFSSFRLLLVQEKEQLLRELRSIDPKGRSRDDIATVNEKIHQLNIDLSHAKEISNKQIAERLVFSLVSMEMYYTSVTDQQSKAC